MFRRIDPPAPAERIHFTFDGAPVTAYAGESLAAALLAAGHRVFRTTPTQPEAPRAPYCMMGVCFDCLVTIDDQPDCQSCMVIVRPNMRVQSQKGRQL